MIGVQVKTTKTAKQKKRMNRKEALVERAFELLETAEILADPAAMKAIRDAEAGRNKCYKLEDLPD